MESLNLNQEHEFYSESPDQQNPPGHAEMWADREDKLVDQGIMTSGRARAEVAGKSNAQADREQHAKGIQAELERKRKDRERQEAEEKTRRDKERREMNMRLLKGSD